MNPTKQLHQTIIDQCKSNDAKAQMQLYNLYAKVMFTVAVRYMKDNCLAEDVMQDAFIKAFKNIKSYKNEVAFGSWLKRIVINQCIDSLKQKKLELVAINEEIIGNLESDNWYFESDICIDLIVSKINELKDKYRLV